jgi:hypothetical protein
MSSEWMKVMLDEITRKKVEAEQAQIELDRRRAENETPPATAPPATTLSGVGV